jgi:high-affinity iron transporter
VGAIAVIAVVWGMARLGKRLRAAPLLSALGTMLCLISVVLIGKGVRALQEAGAVAIAPLGALRIDWLGFYPTVQTILAQLAIALAFAGVAMWAIVRSGRPARPT